MWETIKEIYLSVKKTSTDRIKSPFYGVFILTWVAFNWQPIAIVLFSKLTMENRIGFINAIYPFQLWWPLGVSAVLAYALPFINEKFTYFQSKPISRTAVVLAIRRKRALVADISVEKYRAKRDVTYDRNVAGAEKEIQSMREENLASKKRMGEINAERELLKSELTSVHTLLNQTKNNADRFSLEAQEYQKKYKETEEMNLFLKSSIEKSEEKIHRFANLYNELENTNKTITTQMEEYEKERITLAHKLKNAETIIESLKIEINKNKKTTPQETISLPEIPIAVPRKVKWRKNQEE